MQINLSFSSGNAPELQKLTIQRMPSEPLRVFVRGQFAFDPTHQTIPWTSGVHALCLLLIESLRPNLSGAEPHLSGTRGSAASTLDFAISKQPRWLVDLFGCCAQGRSLFARSLLIGNSHGKREGVISIRLKANVGVNVLNASGSSLTQGNIAALRTALRASWKPYGTRRSARSTKVARHTQPLSELPQSTTARFTSLLDAELSACLSALDVFDPLACAARLRELSHNSSFTRVAGTTPFAFAEELLKLPASLQRGIGSWSSIRRALEARPLSVAVGMCNIGPLALFSHLAQVHDLPIDVDSNFVHALEIGNRVLARDPLLDHDLISIASAPAASLLANRNRHDYVPVMFLPFARQRIVRSRTAPNQLSIPPPSAISLLFETPSTASFYFDSLVERKFFPRPRVKRLHHEPWETAQFLASGDPSVAAILFFPYAELNVWAGNCVLLEPPQPTLSTAEVILFAKRELVADRSRFLPVIAAVRMAWATLIDCPVARSATIESFAGQPEYLQKLTRAAGLSDTRSPSTLGRFRNLNP